MGRKLSTTSLLFILSLMMVGSVADARVGSSRSFGSRGSRGFSMPSQPRYSAPRNYGNSYSHPRTPDYSNPNQNQSPDKMNPSYSTAPRPSLWRSFGAGLAGGFLGSMLFRHSGIGGYGSGYGYSGVGGGIGIFEVLIFGALIFFLVRFLTRRTSSSYSDASRSRWQDSPRSTDTDSDAASEIMRRAKPFGWNRSDSSSLSSVSDRNQYDSEFQNQDCTPIDTDQAMDLFFQIQGAWGNRDLSSVRSVLDSDARVFLEEEIAKLKREHRINRLENIAVRNTQVVESWNEEGKDFSTVRFTANVRDYVIDENTQQIIEGSPTTPVKFDEFWTFSKDSHSGNWKLSAIQQT